MGLTSWAISKGVTVDTSPPKSGLVLVGTQHSHRVEQACSKIEVHWRDFHDDESMTLDYQVAVGSHPNTQDALPFQAVSSGFAVLANLTIQEGHGYYVQIKVSYEKLYILFSNIHAKNLLSYE